MTIIDFVMPASERIRDSLDHIRGESSPLSLGGLGI